MGPVGGVHAEPIPRLRVHRYPAVELLAAPPSPLARAPLARAPQTGGRLGGLCELTDQTGALSYAGRQREHAEPARRASSSTTSSSTASSTTTTTSSSSASS